jgi:hypothetical protein
MIINFSYAPFVVIALNKNLLSISTKNVPMKAMHLTNVNFVIKDLMENIFSIGILNQFMSEINHMKETFEMCHLWLMTSINVFYETAYRISPQ